MIDPSSGLFAFDRPRALDEARELADEGLGKVLNPDDRKILTQLWTPADYITAAFGWGDLDDPHVAYVMAWIFGEDGMETELGLGEDNWDLQNAAVDEVFRSADGETESRYIQDANDDSVTVYQEAERGLLALRRFPPATPERVRDELASVTRPAWLESKMYWPHSKRRTRRATYGYACSEGTRSLARWRGSRMAKS